MEPWGDVGSVLICVYTLTSLASSSCSADRMVSAGAVPNRATLCRSAACMHTQVTRTVYADVCSAAAGD